MIGNSYRYALAMYTNNGGLLAQVAVAVDWDPAFQWGLLQGLRRGRLSLGGCDHKTQIEPIWSAAHGAPKAEAIRVRVTDERGGKVAAVVPTTYFASLAQAASVQLVAQGLLEEGDLFRYEILAEPLGSDVNGGGSTGITLAASRPPMTPIAGTEADYTHAGQPFGEVHADDIPAYIPREILNEVEQMSHDAGAIETGGFLIGHLLHDPSVPDLFAHVTAQVPASHTRAEMAKLTFTPDTWTDARNAIEIRGDNEIILGWWHSHPYMKKTCGDCAKQHDGSCSVNAAFMSEADCQVHRTCFPRAYSLALVVADTPCAPTYWSLFGWREGMVRRRGFTILEPGSAVGAAPAATATTKGH